MLFLFSFEQRRAASVGKNISDGSQSLSLQAACRKADTKVRSTTAVVGAKAQKKPALREKTQAVADVGARWNRTHTSGYAAKFDGKDAFKYGKSARNSVGLPINASVKTGFSAGAWTLRPEVQVGMTYNIGRLKSDTEVRGVTLSAMDKTTNQVCGCIQTRANIGIQAQSGQFTAGLRFGITKGSAGKPDKSVTAEARIRF